MLWSLIRSAQGTSNEYPQHMFLWRWKKNIDTFQLEKNKNDRILLWMMSANVGHNFFLCTFLVLIALGEALFTNISVSF